MLIQGIASVAGPAIGSLFVGMALRRKLDELSREADRLAWPKAVPSFRRPSYKPRWRFPFRAVRSASLWVILVVLAARSLRLCTPEPRPIPAVIDCDHDRLAVARLSCTLAEAAVLTAFERLRR